jgi:YegS/Rv2252/BmrU family lipid kinase
MAKDLSAKWLIIVNPNAGGRKGEKEWPGICKILKQEGFEAECLLTERRYHAMELAKRSIGEGFRNIGVVGGDGTLNEVMNGIFLQGEVSPQEVSLGMIPVGTGNDWGRSFGIPFDARKAIAILKRKKTRLQDTGKITYCKGEEFHTRYFMNVAGMGYDALVAKKTNLLKEKGKGGTLAYIYFVFASLFQYRFIDAVVEVDDREIFRGEIFSMNAGICRYNGGGMIQVPFALPDDGLMDFTLIRKASKFIVIRHTRKLYNGTIADLPIVSTYRGKSFRIRSGGKIFLEADGESLGHSPFTFEIIPGSLRVITGN